MGRPPLGNGDGDEGRRREDRESNRRGAKKSIMEGKLMLRIAFFGSCFMLLGLAGCSSQQSLPTMAAITPAAATPTLVAVTPTSEMGCSVLSAQPTQAVSNAIPTVTSSDFTRGPATAAVTLLAYCDFQSAGCQAYAGILDQLQANHPNDLRMVFRPVPVMSYSQQLDKTQVSVQAALAAADQGTFWEMRDLLKDKYADWSKLSVAQFETWAVSNAADMGIDGA